MNEKLRHQVEYLLDTRELVQRKVDVARRNAEDIKPRVENWLTRVDEIIESSELLLRNEGQQIGLNFIRRYRFDKKAVELIRDILKLEDQGRNFDIVSYDISDESLIIQHTSEFLDFKSRMSTMERVMDALADHNVYKIGVHGMGGVGKTMLVTEISKQVLERRLFDEVVTSTVSQIPNVKRIQEELGDRLCLRFKQETTERRRVKLHKRLKMEQRILVVLDDIWEDISLEAIGIPEAADHRGCKILLISRDKQILLDQNMLKDQIFEIKVLQKVETWNFFKEIVGKTIGMSEWNPIASQVVKECGNLPSAITTVAYTLRRTHPSHWEGVLDQLIYPLMNQIKTMDEKVYSLIKTSYEQLELEEVKLLFLLCSVFPDDYHINVDNLNAYAMVMGFLNDVSTVAQGRCLIENMIDDLISSSMLLQSEFGDNFVTMHDIVRDVAIVIASNNDQVCTLSCAQSLSEFGKMLGNYTAVYMDLYNLPRKLLLPKVRVLILSGPSSHELEFSKDCFGEMNELKLLELHNLKISVLPSSHSLLNLQSLLLYNCELGNIDEIQQLKNLNNLSFKKSNIVEIPIVIGELTQLKVLDLSFCRRLKVIPRNILSRLTKLEELDLEHSFVGWEREELNIKGKNASLCELKYMSRLSTLNLCIQDESVMSSQLFPRDLSLERFKINIGCDWGVYPSKTSKMLCLKVGLRNHLENWMKTLLRRSEELRLKGGAAITNVYELVVRVQHLKHLALLDNAEVEYFIHENEPFWKGFSNLESLYLSELNNMKNVITPGHGQVRESLFKKLKVIKVVKCNQLKNLCFGSGLKSLSNLEKIEISQCLMMEEIVAKESEEAATKIVLLNLNTLILINLPLITSFEEEVGELRPQNSESNPNPFFSQHVSLPNLENLIIRKADNTRAICHSNFNIRTFSKLKKVEIANCDKLESIFSFDMIDTLTSLEEICISCCAILKGIFDTNGGPNFTEIFSEMLPQLTSLTLTNLPNLEYVWTIKADELQMIRNIQLLSIVGCPKLRRPYRGSFLQQL